MTAAERVVRVGRVVWGAVRARVPGAEAAAATSRAALSTPGGRARTIAALQRRVHELERDQALLAAQVAAIGAGRDAEPGDAAASARLDAARLTAIASYEHRIGELERRLSRRDAPGRRRSGRTVVEFERAGR